jgi:hypothetical protein
VFTVLSRIALCATVFVIALVAPAHAGGPTSAILSVPGEGKTASIYYTDPEYDQLGELLGTTNGTAVSGKVDNSGASHESGAGVTVTWLIHDVDPWRIDRIYLDAEGGPWVATQVMTGGGGSIWDSPVVWHQPTSGKELSTLLDELGVGEAARTAGDLDGVAGAPVPAVSEPATPQAAEASSSVNGVWWALGGLAAGILLVLGWMRLRSHREEEQPELDPGTDWLAPQTRSTSA